MTNLFNLLQKSIGDRATYEGLAFATKHGMFVVDELGEDSDYKYSALFLDEKETALLMLLKDEDDLSAALNAHIDMLEEGYELFPYEAEDWTQ